MKSQEREWEEEFDELSQGKMKRVECEGVGDNNGFFEMEVRPVTWEEVKSFIRTVEDKARLQTLNEVREMLPKERIGKVEVLGKIYDNTAWNEAIRQVKSLLDEAIKKGEV